MLIKQSLFFHKVTPLKKLILRCVFFPTAVLYVLAFLSHGLISPETPEFLLIYDIGGPFLFLISNLFLIGIVVARFGFQLVGLLITFAIIFIFFESPVLTSRMWFTLYGLNIIPICTGQSCVYVNDLIYAPSRVGCSLPGESFGYCKVMSVATGPCGTYLLYLPKYITGENIKKSLTNRSNEFQKSVQQETSEWYEYDMSEGRFRLEHSCASM